MKRFLFFILTFVIACAVDPIYYVQNQKGLDYKFSGKKDEHRFGVEVKENQQFHHTITAEDGVRLGCYGHTLDGRKYSTHYVADGKGYRLVPHNAIITVYPKDNGEPRMASFVGAFTETNIKLKNIEYFFPEGCAAPRIEVTEIKDDKKNKNSLTTTENPKRKDEVKKNTGNSIDLTSKYGKENNKNSLSNVDKNKNNQQKVANYANNPNDEDSGKILFGSDTCCNNLRPQVLFPHFQRDTCGKNIAQIVIPIDLNAILEAITMRQLSEIAMESSVQLMLSKLLDFAKAHNL